MKKRIISLIMALVLVLCMSINVFAAPNDVNSIKVVFTRGGVVSYNFPEDPDTIYYEWSFVDEPSGDDIIANLGEVTLSNALLANKSLYTPEGATTPLPGTVSVMDVIMNFKEEFEITTGWDGHPQVGAPGAYVSSILGESGYYDYYYNADGTVFMNGEDLFIAIKDANGVYIPDVYLSSVPAAAGMTIYIDLGYYEYDGLVW